jgi:hypothetical protein
MKKPFLQNSSNVYMQNKLLVCLVGIMALATIWIGIQVSSLKQMHETILIPYGDVEPYVIRNTDANYAYIADMARYIVFLYSNHSATNVIERYDTLLSFFHESALPRYKQHIQDMAKDYAKHPNISHIGAIKHTDGISLLDKRLTIQFEMSRVTGKTVQTPKLKRIYVDYVISNGRFWITEIGEIDQKQQEPSA